MRRQRGTGEWASRSPAAESGTLGWQFTAYGLRARANRDHGRRTWPDFQMEPVTTRLEGDLTSVSVGIDDDRLVFTLFELREVSVAEDDGEHSYLVLTRWQLSVPVPTAGDGPSGATADYLASVVVESTWEPLTRWWRVDDPLGADATARLVEEVNGAIHDGVVRTPVTAAAEALGVPDLAAGILAGIADKAIELPQDDLVSEFGKIVRVAGIGFGVATGNHLLTISSLQSLVRDEVTGRLSELIEGVLTPDQRGEANPIESPRDPTEIDPPELDDGWP